MWTLPNILSFLRVPAAFIFLSSYTPARLIAIFIAMFTDCVDGFLARRSRLTSRFGAILDPATDKFFVVFALCVLFFEGKLELWQACAIISRDFSLIFFGIYLGLSGHWQAFQIQAIRWGKISTALQFFVLMGLTLGWTFSWYVYAISILFGTLAFIELFQVKRSTKLT